MKFQKINELRNYTNNLEIPSRWQETISSIQEERDEIIRAIDFDGKKQGVYGFTSMLGPNDHKSMTSKQQLEMLEGHLIGNPTTLSPIESRAILASKIIQLSNGGTGISLEKYSDLLEKANNIENIIIEIDLDASYGSADVVPAAWWVKSLWGISEEWAPGDLISLINGDFISNAFGYLVFEKLLETIAEFVNLTSGVFMQYPPGNPSNILDEYINKFYVQRNIWDYPPQLPVSQRDSFPIIHAATSVLHNIANTLESAYSSYSGNPIFIKREKSISAVSQSSFLNLELSNSLNSINSFISQISSSIQRATEIICSSEIKPVHGDRSERSNLLTVQLPKVSEAYRVSLSSAFVGTYSGSMSGGVEDFWDLNLINSRNIIRKIDIVNKQLGLLKQSLDIVGINYSSEVSSDELWKYLSNQ